MSVYAPSLYDETFYGEPLSLPVRRPLLDTGHAIWLLAGWGLKVQLTLPERAPDVQRMISDMRAWTGWSQRRLADVLGTSHTTVGRAEAGRPLVEARSGDLRDRVDRAHAVVQRIFLLAERDAEETARLLETPPSITGGGSAVDGLRTGNPDRAYIAALDVLRPRPTGMLVGSRPRRGGATSPLHD
jgi:hypothetical protein